MQQSLYQTPLLCLQNSFILTFECSILLRLSNRAFMLPSVATKYLYIKLLIY
jgi:hypothetical protein